MRDVDERVSAVQRRASRIKRKREQTVVGVLTSLTVIAFVGIVGVPIVSSQVTATSGNSTLFGAASLFGPNAGGYVIVALIAAVAAVLITMFCMMLHRPSNLDDPPQNPNDKKNSR